MLTGGLENKTVVLDFRMLWQHPESDFAGCGGSLDWDVPP
jgi:hypothetical protein